MRSRTYEITLVGQAGATLRAEFDDCEVSIGLGTTTLRAELPDQGALQGLMQRITSLGLELVDLRVAAPPPRNDPCPRPCVHASVFMTASQGVLRSAQR